MKALVLTVTTGPQIGKRHTLSERNVTVGSASSNDLVLQDRTVEPHHAEIIQMLDRWFVMPRIANGRGMSLNGMPVTSRSRLNPDDRLTIGNVTYRVSVTEVLEQEVGGFRPATSVPRLGDYFTRRGLMNGDQVNRTLERQRELARSGNQIVFGQLAYEMGYISRAQLDAALAQQRGDFDEHFRD